MYTISPLGFKTNNKPFWPSLREARKKSKVSGKGKSSALHFQGAVILRLTPPPKKKKVNRREKFPEQGSKYCVPFGNGIYKCSSGDEVKED